MNFSLRHKIKIGIQYVIVMLFSSLLAVGNLKANTAKMEFAPVVNDLVVLATCSGISATNENTYNITITGLDSNIEYNFDFDGDGINEEEGVTGVIFFTTTNAQNFVDGTNSKTVQIDINADGTYDEIFIVHEVLCTDADDNGTLDFGAGCDEDLEGTNRGFIVATTAPYNGNNTYVYVLTNTNNNALAANTSGLFTNLANGENGDTEDYNVLAFNFAELINAAAFITGLTFGEMGTEVTNASSTDGCSTFCGTMGYNIECVFCIEPPLVCNDVIVNLEGGECETIVDFEISTNCTSTITYSPESGSSFPIGSTTINVTVEDEFGNISNCDFEVIVNEFIPMSGDLACNGSTLNFSLDGDCEASISPDMILEGSSYGCYLDFEVMVLSDPNHDDPPLDLPTDEDGFPIIDYQYVGQTLVVKVIDPDTEVSCWGTILIEDKVDPIITCPCEDDPTACEFSCNDLDGILNNTMAGPQATATDNCDPNVSITYMDELTSDGEDCSIATVTRKFIAIDFYGNKDSCEVELIFSPLSLDAVVFPEDIDLDCSESENDLLPDGKLKTGEPQGATCNIVITRDDDIIVEICNGTYKVLRTWSATDWCATAPNNIRSKTQIIKIVDETPPALVCPDGFTIGTSANSCGGNVTLLEPTFTDCGGGVTLVPTATNGIPVFNADTEAWTISDLTATTIITWAATDDCGNTSACSYEINVEDNIAPIVVCDQVTKVALGDEGIIENGEASFVEAMTFDDGSFDNCGIVLYEVARMSQDACDLADDGNGSNNSDATNGDSGYDSQGFGASVPLYCCDIGSTVMIALRVTDAAGNSNTCMVEVQVEDKIAPTIICPDHKIIECTADTSVSVLGFPVVSDNCANPTITYQDSGEIECGEGIIERTWTAIDESGNSTFCIQTITVINSNPFFINEDNPLDPDDDIVWPLDYETNTCGVSLEPEDLPSPYDFPILEEAVCSDIALTHEDIQLDFGADDACLKILRTWKVIDWCQVNDEDLNGQNPDPTSSSTIGVWHYTQVIKVVNSSDPEILTFDIDIADEADFGINSAGDYIVGNLGEGCGEVSVGFNITIDDDCTDNDLIAVAWSFSNGSSGTGLAASDAFDNGIHNITFTINDQCGNEFSKTKTFIVEDKKKPTPVCILGIATAIMPTAGMVMIDANTFESGSSFDNCSDYSQLHFSFSEDMTDNVIAIACDQIPDNGLFPITLYVTDENGNFDFCETFIDVQDPNTVCVEPTAVINGVIENEDEEYVEEVIVTLGNDNGPMTSFAPVTTGSDGYYQFNTSYGEFNVTPEKDINYLNGVTTYDLVLISKHILGTQIFDSPYKWIAADANKSGTITTLDIVKLRALILHIDEELSNNNSWRFVDKDYSFATPNNPLADDFPEFVDLDETSFDPVNFIGIKIGDVNGTSSPNSLLGTDTRNFNGQLTFEIKNTQVRTGETFTIDFKSNDFNSIQGYQFTLNFDKSLAEFVDLKSSLTGLSDKNFGWTKIEEGMITTSWNSNQGISLEDQAVLFSLTFIANRDFDTKDLLKINSRYTAVEAYRNTELLDIVLQVNGAEVVDKFELFQNIPNPFKKETIIGFNMPKKDKVILKIMDSSGRTISLVKLDAQQGYNSVNVDRKILKDASGVLYYQVETSTETAIKKMIIVD